MQTPFDVLNSTQGQIPKNPHNIRLGFDKQMLQISYILGLPSR
jgi:hypothetical protein